MFAVGVQCPGQSQASDLPVSEKVARGHKEEGVSRHLLKPWEKEFKIRQEDQGSGRGPDPLAMGGNHKQPWLLACPSSQGTRSHASSAPCALRPWTSTSPRWPLCPRLESPHPGLAGGLGPSGSHVSPWWPSLMPVRTVVQQTQPHPSSSVSGTLWQGSCLRGPQHPRVSPRS